MKTEKYVPTFNKERRVPPRRSPFTAMPFRVAGETGQAVGSDVEGWLRSSRGGGDIGGGGVSRGNPVGSPPFGSGNVGGMGNRSDLGASPSPTALFGQRVTDILNNQPLPTSSTARPYHIYRASTPTILGANQSDYPFTGGDPYLIFQRLSASVAVNVTGFGTQFNGRHYILTNTGAFNITLKHQDAASGAASRLISPTGADVTMTPDSYIEAVYDHLTARWRLGPLGSSAAGGSGITAIRLENVDVVNPATIIDFDNRDFNVTLEAAGEGLVQILDKLDIHDWSTPTVLGANQNDYPFTGGIAASTGQRMEGSAVRLVTGILAKTAGFIYLIRNIGAFNLLFANQSALSAAANRIITGTGGTITLAPDQLLALIYDDDTARWQAWPLVYTATAGSATFGTGTLDFGAFPGKSDAFVDVVSAGALTTSNVTAWIRPIATTDHTADEHWLESIRVFGVCEVNGTVRIYGRNDSEINSMLVPLGASRTSGAGVVGSQTFDSLPHVGGQGTLIFGQWSVGFQWV